MLPQLQHWVGSEKRSKYPHSAGTRKHSYSHIVVTTATALLCRAQHLDDPLSTSNYSTRMFPSRSVGEQSRPVTPTRCLGHRRHEPRAVTVCGRPSCSNSVPLPFSNALVARRVTGALARGQGKRVPPHGRCVSGASSCTYSLLCAYSFSNLISTPCV